MTLSGTVATPFDVNMKMIAAIAEDHLVTLYYPEGAVPGVDLTFNGASAYTYTSATWNVDQQVNITLHKERSYAIKYRVTSLYTNRTKTGTFNVSATEPVIIPGQYNEQTDVYSSKYGANYHKMGRITGLGTSGAVNIVKPAGPSIGIASIEWVIGRYVSGSSGAVINFPAVLFGVGTGAIARGATLNTDAAGDIIFSCRHSTVGLADLSTNSDNIPFNISTTAPGTTGATITTTIVRMKAAITTTVVSVSVPYGTPFAMPETIIPTTLFRATELGTFQTITGASTGSGVFIDTLPTISYNGSAYVISTFQLRRYTGSPRNIIFTLSPSYAALVCDTDPTQPEVVWYPTATLTLTVKP